MRKTRCGTPRARLAMKKAASTRRLKNMTVLELRNLAKKKRIPCSKMTKDLTRELIKAHIMIANIYTGEVMHI